MIWKIEFDNRARKELRKLDRQTQQRILKWISKNLATDKDPKRKGKGLKGTDKGLWRWRVGDYRIVADIQDEQLLILIVRVRHRRDVYR